eukprot:CAMPEP_0206161066 /NCGR_PEP_ID=MMETSP1474-20131121/7337_1 /ASSEMBLY_ACC=CAM_ASM_001110 /TAXON_ID=97495 /ORGANISM="Imantonia sp., Strain RCC918" /LENGTH=186 /DNA_ID=CAMNT_0053562755 /DNA_START=385 /DNA_END=945 /DNA_ORIENTATION=-
MIDESLFDGVGVLDGLFDGDDDGGNEFDGAPSTYGEGPIPFKNGVIDGLEDNVIEAVPVKDIGGVMEIEIDMDGDSEIGDVVADPVGDGEVVKEGDGVLDIDLVEENDFDRDIVADKDFDIESDIIPDLVLVAEGVLVLEDVLVSDSDLDGVLVGVILGIVFGSTINVKFIFPGFDIAPTLSTIVY